MQKEKLKLLIFDWDGTLADSEALIVNAMRAAITDQNLDIRSNKQIRDVIGLGLMEAVAALFPGLERYDHESLSNSYRQHYSSTATGKTTLFPDVIGTLEHFRGQNYKLAIATGKSRKGLDNSLKETGIQNFFHMTRCADETFSKPHPQMLLDIMDTLVIEPGETLMIGDSEYDMQMAKNANIPAIAVSYGTQNRERLLEHEPLACLDRLEELVDWISCNRS